MLTTAAAVDGSLECYVVWILQLGASVNSPKKNFPQKRPPNPQISVTFGGLFWGEFTEAPIVVLRVLQSKK